MARGNRGQVLVLVALAIFALLGLAALGIDVGYMYSVRHELQRSADAGALAGVVPFAEGNWTESSVRSEADTLAREFATKNNVLGTPVVNGEVTVTFPTQNHIRVDTSRNVNMFFARIFGMQTRTITAHAIARAAPTNGEACITPFAIPIPWVDEDGDNLFDNNIQSERDSVRPFCAQGQVTDCWPTGTQRTLHIGQPNFDSQVPASQETSGQFFIMDGNAGNEYPTGDIWNFIKGEGCMSLDLNRNISLEPGGAMGPVRHGLDQRIDSGIDWNYPTELLPPPPEDRGNRLIYVVVYDPRVGMVDGGGNLGAQGNQAAIPGNNPESPMPTVWYAGFYLERPPGSHNNEWITGRYTGILLNGTGIGNTPGGAFHPELVE